VQKYKYVTVTTDEWKEFFLSYFNKEVKYWQMEKLWCSVAIVDDVASCYVPHPQKLFQVL
jgi:hypothetical protein